MLDLTDQVTVFVITVGSLDFPDCLRQLQEQDSTFQLNIIRNISPMDRAFQQMAERCKTPYFVQVDEDMMLYPHAIRQLREEIAEQPPEVAFHCLSLLDSDLGIPIDGCKIYRHAVIQAYPWRESTSCEVDQFKRMWKDGYRFSRRWRPTIGDHVIGEHGRYWTPRSLFHRYRRLALKYRLDPEMMAWWAQWPNRLAERLAAAGTQRALFALLGWNDGLRCDIRHESGEADFHGYTRDEAFQTYAKMYHLPDGPVVPVSSVRVGSKKAKIHKESIALPKPPAAPALAPTELNLYLTSRCNFKCVWCRRQHHELPEVPDVTGDMVKQIFERWPGIKSACVAGFGEPLLSENLEEVFAALRKKDVPINLITNGALVLARKEILVACQPGQISISLNAATAKEHKATTGTDTWEDVIAGVRWLQEYHYKVFLSFVITKDTLLQIGAYLDLAESLGCPVDLLSVLPHFSDSRDSEAFWKTALLSDHVENEMWLRQWRKHPHAGQVRTWPTLIRKDPETCPRSCDSPQVAVGVDGAGNLSACRRILPPSPGGGNLQDADAWNSGECAALRRKIQAWQMPDLCTMCQGNWRK